MSVSFSDIDRVYLNNKAMATIVKSISNPPLTLWATFVPCVTFVTETLKVEWGEMERDQISDIRPPKNQISDIRPPKKSNIRYHMFAKNQISGLKNQISDPPQKN